MVNKKSLSRFFTSQVGRKVLRAQVVGYRCDALAFIAFLLSFCWISRSVKVRRSQIRVQTSCRSNLALGLWSPRTTRVADQSLRCLRSSSIKTLQLDR